MKWFIIVVMMWQPVGKPETPLYIPFMEFADKEQCMTFARNNQLRLFNKSHDCFTYKINFVNEDIMKQVGQLIWRGRKNEDDI